MGQERKLNDEQLAAVEFGKGPLLIIAGAGTGKTTVVTERIKHLITKKLAKPSEILALTFTEKAAREMEERVDEAMPYGYTQMWISTFHSFCDRILRAEALQIGLSPNYKLMTGAETIQLIRNNLFKFDLNYFRPLGNPTKFIDGMLQHFSRLQDEDISPLDYVRWVKVQSAKCKAQSEEQKTELEKWEELAGAYRTYEELKVKEGVMDFGDLIVKTLQLFRSRPNVLKRYRDQFKYVLVDEFQDTNFAQNELAIRLAGKDPTSHQVSRGKENITVCGDDDQSIYRFRGAAVSNIIQFRKNFPKAKVVVLTRNYRSTQEILDKSYSLIQNNNPDRLEIVENVDKKLIANRPHFAKASRGDPIVFIHSDRVENEAEMVAKEIAKLTSTPEVPKHPTGDTNYQPPATSYSFSDFAILVRANNHAEPFMRALSRHTLPYQFLGPGRLFKQPEIVDLISYLKVLYNYADSVAFYRILSMDYLDISAREIATIGMYAKKFNLSLFEAAEKVDSLFVSDGTKQRIKKLLGIVNKHLELVKKETAGQILYYFLTDTGLIQKLISPDNPDAEKRAKNISKFFDKLKTYEVDHDDATVPAVVDWLELSSELGESPLAANEDWSEINAVNILTVHSAKGLEFPVVFLVNLVAQRFPTIERREQIPIPDELIKEVLPKGDYHLEEERRLFYVGMTRAKDRLYFTAADYYGEGKREKKLSPFIFEALGDKVLGSEVGIEKGKQLSFLDYAIPQQFNNETMKQFSPVHIDYLSYSQIETFRICPLHYKLKYILKIPTPPSPSQSFGTSVHFALKDFYLTIKLGVKPSKDLIISTFKRDWVREGYASKSHEEKMFEKGKMFLTDFYKNQFDPKKIPVMLEQPFVIPLNAVNSKYKIRNPKQYQISNVQNSKSLKVGGKIDRVDALPDGRIEIIDYKTGANVPTQKDIDRDLQMTFYALAATTLQEPPFNKKPEEVKLTFYYFDNQKTISTIRTTKDLEKAKEEIFAVRSEIEKSDFACSGSFLCQNCEYSLFCRAEK